MNDNQHSTAFPIQMRYHNKEDSMLDHTASNNMFYTQQNSVTSPQLSDDQQDYNHNEYSASQNHPQFIPAFNRKMSTLYHRHSNEDHYSNTNFFDETSVKQEPIDYSQQHHVISTTQMKRSSTDSSHHVLGGMVNYPEQHYFPFDSNHYKQMAGSAPSNMNLHGYPFNNGSDDMISIANSQQSPTSTNLMMFSDNNSNNEFLEDNGNNNIEDYTTQANMQAIMEKRRRRRESHNAVERRRRDNINERIQELGTLLPENVDDGINRMNKGTILRKSVEQIRKLQNDIIQYQHRVRELEVVLQQIRQNSQQHGTTTTATILRN